MQVQINTDHNIDGRETLAAHVREVVTNALNHVGDQVTRVEVHLSDANSHKSGGNDKGCVMEARVQGLAPLAVTHHAASLHQAIDGAADKLTRVVESTIKRRRDHRNDATDPSPAERQSPAE